MDDHLKLFTKIFGEGAPYVAEVIHIAEAVLEGQVKISQAGLYVMEHIDKEACYDLYEKAFAAATTPAARNNIRLMRLEFRYSDLECRHTALYHQQGQRYTPYEVCDDPTGELYYMSRNFDSSRWCNPGLGIMFPLEGEKQNEFVPDYWYLFEQEA